MWDAAEGFAALVRLVGLPSGEMIGYLGSEGGFFPGGQNHGYNYTYLDERRVIIEPQAEYLSPGYIREPLSESYNQLIRNIPMGKRNQFVDRAAETNSTDWQAIADDLARSGLAENNELLAMARDLARKHANLGDIFVDPFFDSIPVPGGRPVTISSGTQSHSASDILMTMISQNINDSPKDSIDPENALATTRYLVLLGYMLRGDESTALNIHPDEKVAIVEMMQKLGTEPDQQLMRQIISQMILGEITDADKLLQFIRESQQSQKLAFLLLQQSKNN